MGQNILFNYIHNHLRGRAPKGCTKLSFKKDKTQTPYYLLDLPKKEITLEDENHNTYTLQSHHLSVYSKVKKSNPFLSESHYTGYFLDQNGKTCQLHVYFNGDDIPAFTSQNLNFSRQQGGAKLSSDLDDQWMGLMFSVIELPMGDLRKGLAGQVRILENDYPLLEQKATDLSENQSREGINEYKQALVKLERILDQLIPLVAHHEYKNIQKLISSLISSIEKLTPEPQLQLSRRTNKAKSRKMVSQPQSIFEPIKIEQDNHLDDLKNLSAKFSTICAQDLATQAPGFAKLRAEVFGFAALLPKNASLALLKELKKLQGNIENKGKNLLGELLAANQFELAKELKPFHYILTHESLIKALQENKPDLLEFILAQGLINIDQPFTLKNNVYQSSIEYCFINYPDEIACLSVLVHHNGSLMIKDKQGLPLAFHLVNPHHPLNKVLTDNAKQTTFSISFCKKLIANLQLFLKEKHKQPVNLIAIQDSIIFYQDRLLHLQLQDRLSAVNQIKIGDAVGKLDVLTENSPLRNRMEQDPAIVSLQFKYRRATKEHMDELNSKTFNQEMNSRINVVAKQNDNFQKHFNNKDLVEYLDDEANYPAIRIFLIQELQFDIRAEELRLKNSNTNEKPSKSLVLAINQLAKEREESIKDLYASYIQTKVFSFLIQMLARMAKLGRDTAEFKNIFLELKLILLEYFDNLHPEQLQIVGEQLALLIGEKNTVALFSNFDENSEESISVQDTSAVANAFTFFQPELTTLKPSVGNGEELASKGPPQ